MKSTNGKNVPIPGKSKSDLTKEVKEIRKQSDRELSIWRKFACNKAKD
jgi:hypothetical protein